MPAKFFTLTFPASAAPDERDAHKALRSLVRRLRYRQLLGEYGWVLQRQDNGVDAKAGKPARKGTLHYHGIAHMPWLDIDEWRGLVVASGFGPIQNLQVARVAHAGYCASYIASRLADLAPLHRAYGFSRAFPLDPFEERKRNIEEIGTAIGLASECEWVPGWMVHL